MDISLEEAASFECSILEPGSYRRLARQRQKQEAESFCHFDAICSEVQIGLLDKLALAVLSCCPCH